MFIRSLNFCFKFKPQNEEIDSLYISVLIIKLALKLHDAQSQNY
jgi:hypothetical protein